MQAMILAAGFGTRLLPFTKLRPKPLFPLLNEPLLLLTIRHLKAAGFDHIIVNCHYLKEQIVALLTGIPGVCIQQEDSVLGTGGGLRLAMENLRDEPLLVTNADIYHTVDYRELYSAHQQNDAVVTMAMHDYPRFNKVTVEGDQITGFSDEGMDSVTRLAFTGLHVLEPEILHSIPIHQNYSIINCYRNVLNRGDSICSFRVDSCSWTDMGTVDDYLALHGKLLQGKIPLWPEFKYCAQDPLLVHEDASCASGVTLSEWVCVGNATLGNNSKLQRCVVWDDAIIDDEETYCDVLLVPDG